MFTFNKELDQNVTRRQALAWVASRGIEATIYSAVVWNASRTLSDRDIEQVKKVAVDRNDDYQALDRIRGEEYHAQGNDSPQEIEPLKPGYFGYSIAESATEITSSDSDDLIIQQIAGGVWANLAITYLMRRRTGLIHGGVGVASFLGGRVIDDISTVIMTNKFEDPRVREYQLSNYFYESNTDSPSDPTTSEVIKSNGKNLAKLLPIAAAIPAFGRTYLGVSPSLAMNNLRIAHTVGVAMEIGDGVKGLIGDNKDQDYIYDFLRQLPFTYKEGSVVLKDGKFKVKK